MASRFACIATSRRRRALAASLSSHAVRTRRATASMRRMAGSWQDMVEGERKLPEGERIDFVTIVTPNVAHYAIRPWR